MSEEAWFLGCIFSSTDTTDFRFVIGILNAAVCLYLFYDFTLLLVTFKVTILYRMHRHNVIKNYFFQHVHELSLVVQGGVQQIKSVNLKKCIV